MLTAVRSTWIMDDGTSLLLLLLLLLLLPALILPLLLPALLLPAEFVRAADGTAAARCRTAASAACTALARAVAF
jgi:hypothetical protein